MNKLYVKIVKTAIITLSLGGGFGRNVFCRGKSSLEFMQRKVHYHEMLEITTPICYFGFALKKEMYWIKY